MKKLRICLALTMIIAMLFVGCGTATTSSNVESELTGKEDVAIKGDVNITASTNDGSSTTNDASNPAQNNASNSSSKNEGASNNNSSNKQDGNTNKPSGNSNKPSGNSNKPSGNTNKPSGDKEFNAEIEIEKVETKEYTVKAKGSKYADGIMLPKLTKKQATISFMTNNTWEQLGQESTENNPTAYYHAMLIWKETYGVPVDIEIVDWGSFTNHLITSVVAGDSPEICRWVDGKPRWINNNLVTTLEDKLDLKEDGYDLEKMQSAAAMYGHVYAAYGKGLQMPVQVIAYNKTKFANAGETDPMTLFKKGKWNWTQFVKTAANMTDAANDEYGVAGTGCFFANNFLLMNLNDDGTVALHTKEPRFVKSMQAVWKLYREENAARRKDEHRDTFPLGKDAMAPTVMRDYCRMMETAKQNGTTDEFGIVPFPAYDFLGETKPYGYDTTHLEGLAISAKPQNMEGAVEFIRLASKVATNISEKLGKWGWAKAYMTNEEKEVFSKVKYFNWGKSDCTTLIANNDDHLDNYLKYPICLAENVTMDLSTILANAHSAMEGIIYEYEVNAGVRS